ncbi:hypothetical protein V8G54_037184 [Vigna mungo]|uniref:Uncharacterized protein n=1 Tax=Vigna mungo TaxID=3915 RepID=A0AAQ3MIR8_VIGMU
MFSMQSTSSSIYFFFNSTLYKPPLLGPLLITSRVCDRDFGTLSISLHSKRNAVKKFTKVVRMHRFDIVAFGSMRSCKFLSSGTVVTFLTDHIALIISLCKDFTSGEN